MKINEEDLHLSICDKLIDIGIMFQEDNLCYTLYGLTCGRKVQYFGLTGKIMIDGKQFNGMLEDLKLKNYTDGIANNTLTHKKIQKNYVLIA